VINAENPNCGAVDSFLPRQARKKNGKNQEKAKIYLTGTSAENNNKDVERNSAFECLLRARRKIPRSRHIRGLWGLLWQERAAESEPSGAPFIEWIIWNAVAFLFKEGGSVAVKPDRQTDYLK